MHNLHGACLDLNRLGTNRRASSVASRCWPTPTLSTASATVPGVPAVTLVSRFVVHLKVKDVLHSIFMCVCMYMLHSLRIVMCEEEMTSLDSLQRVSSSVLVD
jgi:hypothetical protein